MLLFLYYRGDSFFSSMLPDTLEWYLYLAIIGIVIGVIISVFSYLLVRSSSLKAHEELEKLTQNEELLLELGENEPLSLTKGDVTVAILFFALGVVILNILLVFTPLNMVIRESNLFLMGGQLTYFYLILLLVAVGVSFLLSRFLLTFPPLKNDSESSVS